MDLKTTLMAGKRGLIMGVANDRSIAWGIAKHLYLQGAELAFTYQGPLIEKRVRPLAYEVGTELVMSCDVENQSEQEAVFERLQQEWGIVDFVVHSLAYTDKDELSSRYTLTTKENFVRTMHISCFSLTNVAKLVHPLMSENGGSILTLTYFGAEKVIPNYNIMGVSKAALEASVRYLAADLGPDGIRINSLSAGPMKTLAGSVIRSARAIYKWSEANSPLRKAVTQEQLGGAALYLLSDLSLGVTGENHHVDSGYNIIGVPDLI